MTTAVGFAACATPAETETGDDGVIAATQQAIVLAPPGQWKWYDVPGTKCGLGQQTGFAINVGTSNEVFMYMVGGGACSYEMTCRFDINGAKIAFNFLTGYDSVNFFQGTGSGAGDNPWQMEQFNRTDKNPYKDATFVFIPYCSGDFHSGSTSMWFPGIQRTAYFNGRNNLDLDLQLIVPALPNASRITLAGTSAGAFGAEINYEFVRQKFGNKRVDLVTDSGPFLWNNALIFSGMGTWNAQAAFPQGCTNCWSDYTNLYRYYDNKYTDSRFALLSNDMDLAISTAYTLLFYPMFYQALKSHASNVLNPLLRTRYFIPDGTVHGIFDYDQINPMGKKAQPRDCNWLGPICTSTYNNGPPTALRDWLTAMKTDSPSWNNVTGMIMQACTPDCSHNQCGSDGCGQICGTCGTDMSCTPSSQCLYDKGCTIGGVNYDNGQHNPADFHQACDRANPFAWTTVSTGTTCPSGTAELVHAQIESAYLALGGCSSVLGVPTSRVSMPPDMTGRYAHFSANGGSSNTGSIYWHPSTGAAEVHGAIRTYWANAGWELSTYGYPVSNQAPASSGNAVKSVFQSGAIYSSPTTGTHGVIGAIWTRYKSMQADVSALGIPISDEFATGFFLFDRRQNFEHGYIYWSAAGGTSVTLN